MKVNTDQMAEKQTSMEAGKVLSWKSQEERAEISQHFTKEKNPLKVLLKIPRAAALCCGASHVLHNTLVHGQLENLHV